MIAMHTRNFRFLALPLAIFSFSALSQTSGRSPTSSINLQQQLTQGAIAAISDCVVKSETHKAAGRTTIYVRPGRTVTIGLQPDETVTTTIWDQGAPGEFIQDFVHPDGRSITLRLLAAVPVPGVITTNLRRYFVVIFPSDIANPTTPCYQGVLFQGSEGGPSSNPFGSTIGTGVGAASISETASRASPDASVFSGSPNFDYLIAPNAQGAAIKPSAVYDNGRFTWIHFGGSVQALPAVFYVGPSGLEVVNVTPTGAALLVNRLMDKFVLKLGDAEVSITANRR